MSLARSGYLVWSTLTRSAPSSMVMLGLCGEAGFDVAVVGVAVLAADGEDGDLDSP